MFALMDGTRESLRRLDAFRAGTSHSELMRACARSRFATAKQWARAAASRDPRQHLPNEMHWSDWSRAKFLRNALLLLTDALEDLARAKELETT